MAAKVEPVRRCKQVGRADKVILQERQLAFCEIGKASEEPIADEPAQHGIAEEFETFVVGAEVGDGGDTRRLRIQADSA
jgi:hypothetical protein